MGFDFPRILFVLVLLSCAGAGVGGSLACSSPSKPTADAGGDVLPRDGGLDAAPAGPSLVSLEVSGPGSLTLVPPFAPDTYDYYVPCAKANELTVALTASSGALGRLEQPKKSPSLPDQTLKVNVAENQAIVAVATRGDATTEYWVRCLPPDFPVLAWSPHPEAGARSPGYYLVGNVLVDPSASLAGYAMVLDKNGVPVWYLRAPTNFGMSTVDSLSPGTVSYLAYNFPGVGPFSVRDLSHSTTATIAPDGGALDSHELYLLENGDYLAFTVPLTAGVDLQGVSAVLADGGVVPLGTNSLIQDCEIVELAPDGSIVWSWLASDHFDPRQDTTLAAASSAPDGGLEVDVFHCNSIDVDKADGSLLVSARNMSSVFYIDRSSKAVVWKMGGADASQDNATYVSVKDPFSLQHDARFQASWSSACRGGSGQVSVFDDESLGPAPARAVVYDVVVGEKDAGTAACDAGGAPGTATRVWQYQGESSSGAMGSFRVLADGSRIIGWGVSTGTTFTEVNLSGKDLLDFTLGGGNPSYRAIKVPLSAFDLSVLRSTAGSP
jgi:hypothetical protein